MEESTPREKVLKKVRDALISRTDPPFPRTNHDKPVFHEMEEPPDIHFAQELNKAGGNFIYCETEQEFVIKLGYLLREKKWSPPLVHDKGLQAMLQESALEFIDAVSPETETTDAALTRCDYLVARYGCVVITSSLAEGRRLQIFPDNHIILAYTSRIVPELRDALAEISKDKDYKPSSSVTFITGPSRTADIEKTLVMGAHGPKGLYVFLVEDRSEPR
jgi:L-lactate dehydrogenase complex protein LldG